MWNWSENNDILENYPPYKNAPLLGGRGEAECHKNDIIFFMLQILHKNHMCNNYVPLKWQSKKIYPRVLSLESINILGLKATGFEIVEVSNLVICAFYQGYEKWYLGI